MTVRLVLVRWVAPAALLLAVTLALLAVRPGRSGNAPVGAKVPAVAKVPAQRHAAPRSTARYYLIQSGDTYERIALQFHTTVDRLLRLNPGVDHRALRPGQKIRIR